MSKPKTVVCLASGPSLTQEDVDYCKGKADIYAVKECWLMAKDCQMVYAADGDWWDHYEGLPEYKGRKITVNVDAANKWDLECVTYISTLNWNCGGHIATGGNSGFQAMALAEMHGYERIILLGYDYGFKPNQDKHWWDATIKRHCRSSNYTDWIKRMNQAAPLIQAEVLNASRESAINCFPRVDIKDVL